MGGEPQNDRNWLGELQLVAVFDRALDAVEVFQNFEAGPQLGPVAPSIVVQPLPQTVDLGATATFSVTAAGDAPLSYQWQRNQVNIPGAMAASYTTPPVAL